MMHFPDWRMHQPWDIFTRLDFYNLPFYWRKLMTLKFSDVIFPLNREASPFDNRLIWRRYEVHGYSQDSDTAILSAFRARSFLIIRYTFPVTLIIPQLEDLLAIAACKHIRRRTLRPTLRTILKILKRRLLPNLQQYHKYRRKLLQSFNDSDSNFRGS